MGVVCFFLMLYGKDIMACCSKCLKAYSHYWHRKWWLYCAARQQICLFSWLCPLWHHLRTQKLNFGPGRLNFYNSIQHSEELPPVNNNICRWCHCVFVQPTLQMNLTGFRIDCNWDYVHILQVANATLLSSFLEESTGHVLFCLCRAPDIYCTVSQCNKCFCKSPAVLRVSAPALSRWDVCILYSIY